MTKYSDNTSLEDILNGKAQGTTMYGSAEPPNTKVRIKSVPEGVVKDTSSYCVPVGSSISMNILTYDRDKYELTELSIVSGNGILSGDKEHGFEFIVGEPADENDTIVLSALFWSLPHTHSFEISLSSSGDMAYVKCTKKDCAFGTGENYSVTISAKDKTYDGSPAEAAAFSYDKGFPKDDISVGAVDYSGTGSTVYSGMVPPSSG